MNRFPLRLASPLIVGISFALFAGLARVNAEVIFVHADAVGNNDGTSWENAFTDLQDALAASEGGDQIWVAAATYRPAGPAGDRTATFQLISGVGLYGGFAGGETELDERDPDVNVTVLSGDLNGDDGEDFANNDENSYHVVNASDTDADAALDGFTITGGNANGDGPSDQNIGGGLYIMDGDLLVANCTVLWNTAAWGGAGMFNLGDSIVVDSTFLHNTAMYNGGGMYSYGYPLLLNCAFIGNSALEFGQGGGLYSGPSGNPTLTNCLFSRNWASNAGGGIFVDYNDAPLPLTNCTFNGNSAGEYGGGLAGHDSDAILTNCILWGNSDEDGMDQGAQVSFFDFNYSCVQGWTGGGTGNLGDDPLFVDADGPDDIPGTADDDLRLSPGSPCIDAADNESVPADEFDLDEDGDTTEPIPFDLDGHPRFVDDPATDDTGNGTPPIVDMGSYEFRIEDFPCDGDANGDGTVDPLDSGFVLSRLGCEVDAGDPDCDTADQNGDGLVDPLDVGFVLARFGECS